jgi:4-aminobutyrate aminotransferase-like enzyme
LRHCSFQKRLAATWLSAAECYGSQIVNNPTSRSLVMMTQLLPLLKQATPVLAARGEGVYLYGEDGRRYLDFTAGIGVTSTGHCHARVVEYIGLGQR